MNYKATIEVVVNGRVVKHYKQGDKTYIEAKAGTQYELRVRNNTDARILAVVSVDGLNVITGERATPEDTGYLISSYGSLPIKGFRYSDEEVGAFKFVTKANSYNAQSGEDTSNIGVIGLIAFEDLDEKTRREQTALLNMRYRKGAGGQSAGGQHVNTVASYRSLVDRSFHSDNGKLYSSDFGAGATSWDSRPSTPEAVLDGRGAGTTDWADIDYNRAATLDVNHTVGTGWGDTVQQACRHVNFNRGVQIAESLVFYSSREALIKSGIIDPTPVAKIPSAFEKKYATPPPGFGRNQKAVVRNAEGKIIGMQG